MAPSPQPPRDRRATAALLVVLALGAAWRVVGLDRESFWHDEVITYDLLTMPIGDALADLAADGHPPLYPLLLRGWAALFGTSPAALRGLSALLVTLGIPFLYRIASRWRGFVAGIAVAVLAAFSSFLVRYSQEARDYSLLFLCATASFHALDRAVERPTATRLAAWAAALALTLWSSVFGMAVLVTQALWLAGVGVASRATVGPPRAVLRAAVPWVLGILAALLAFGPWLVVLARRTTVLAHGFWVPTPDWDSIEGSFMRFAGTRRGLVLLLPLAALGGWRETFGAGAIRRRGFLVLAWLAGPVLLPFLTSHVAFPVFVPRGTIVACGAFLLLVALGLDALRGRRALFLAGAAVIVLVVGLGIHRQVTRVDREDWRAVAAHLQANAAPADRVLLASELEALAIRIYEPKASFAWSYVSGAAATPTPEAGDGPLWVVRSEHAPRMPKALDRLRAAGWRPASTASFPRILVERWER